MVMHKKREKQNRGHKTSVTNATEMQGHLSCLRPWCWYAKRKKKRISDCFVWDSCPLPLFNVHIRKCIGPHVERVLKSAVSSLVVSPDNQQRSGEDNSHGKLISRPFLFFSSLSPVSLTQDCSFKGDTRQQSVSVVIFYHILAMDQF